MLKKNDEQEFIDIPESIRENPISYEDRENSKFNFLYKTGFFMSFIVFSYILSNLMLIIVFIVNFPIVVDAITFGNLNEILVAAKSYYVMPGSAAMCISLIDLIIFSLNYAKRRFPSFLSFITMLYNNLLCLIFLIVVYCIDAKNVYFSMQATLTIPIITIMLSTAFVVDDYVDLLKERFSFLSFSKDSHASSDDEKILDLNKPAAELMAADAAKLAIPTLHSADKEEEETDEKEEEKERAEG